MKLVRLRSSNGASHSAARNPTTTLGIAAISSMIGLTTLRNPATRAATGRVPPAPPPAPRTASCRACPSSCDKQRHQPRQARTRRCRRWTARRSSARRSPRTTGPKSASTLASGCRFVMRSAAGLAVGTTRRSAFGAVSRLAPPGLVATSSSVRCRSSAATVRRPSRRRSRTLLRGDGAIATTAAGCGSARMRVQLALGQEAGPGYGRTPRIAAIEDDDSPVPAACPRVRRCARCRCAPARSARGTVRDLAAPCRARAIGRRGAAQRGDGGLGMRVILELGRRRIADVRNTASVASAAGGRRAATASGSSGCAPASTVLWTTRSSGPTWATVTAPDSGAAVARRDIGRRASGSTADGAPKTGCGRMRRWPSANATSNAMSRGITRPSEVPMA